MTYTRTPFRKRAPVAISIGISILVAEIVGNNTQHWIAIPVAVGMLGLSVVVLRFGFGLSLDRILTYKEFDDPTD